MAKYVPMELIESLSGKVCGHSDMYFANRKGTLYTGKICNPYKGEPSALQIAQRNKFKQVLTAIAALTAEEKATYAVDFRKQKEYNTLRGYMFAQEYAKLS
jgi:hypothetical protein